MEDEIYKASAYTPDASTDITEAPDAPFPHEMTLSDAPRPWYTSREYLLGGWADTRVWRAAVG